MSSRRDERIAPTGHYTAYVWKRKGYPFAELFATKEGAVLFHAYRALVESISPRPANVPRLEDMLEYRHLLLDRAADLLRPTLIVELGAGLSRRGVTFASRGVPYLEIDLPGMVAAKGRRIEAAPPGVRSLLESSYRLVAHDLLAPDFPAFLTDALRGQERAVVIAEGVLGYFPVPERRLLASTVARALGAAEEGHFLFDLRDQAHAKAAASTVRTLKWASSLVTRGRGLREDFEDSDAIRAFLREAGFDAMDTVEPAPPHLRRFAMPNRVWRAHAVRRTPGSPAEEEPSAPS
ncbi:MAG: class I SAM-dependent methyltransferase [Polyangiales bacterium]